jgi:hypothetical protein
MIHTLCVDRAPFSVYFSHIPSRVSRTTSQINSLEHTSLSQVSLQESQTRLSVHGQCNKCWITGYKEESVRWYKKRVFPKWRRIGAQTHKCESESHSIWEDNDTGVLKSHILWALAQEQFTCGPPRIGSLGYPKDFGVYREWRTSTLTSGTCTLDPDEIC